MKTSRVTGSTLTHQEILDLQREAQGAGDTLTVNDCQTALGDDSPKVRRAARARLAAVINEARAGRPQICEVIGCALTFGHSGRCGTESEMARDLQALGQTLGFRKPEAAR